MKNPLTKHRIVTLEKTLCDLAEASGVYPSVLSAVERGHWHKCLHKRKKFAEIYGLTLEAYEEMVKGAWDGDKGEQP
jgi:transcriptional regulator with XRE-family HTH domain